MDLSQFLFPPNETSQGVRQIGGGGNLGFIESEESAYSLNLRESLPRQHFKIILAHVFKQVYKTQCNEGSFSRKI